MFFNINTSSISVHSKHITKVIEMSFSVNENLSDMRAEFKGKVETFTEDKLVSKNPIIQFNDWLEIARSTPEIYESDVMILTTATINAIPSARPVLMKGYSDEGFKYCANYDSGNGQDLVRIEGTVERTLPEDSDQYFRDKPFPPQIAACASSRVTAQYENSPIDRRPCWGDYIVKPHSIEFWQGQKNRLHDRIRFRSPQSNDKVDNVLLHQGENGWIFERLSP